MSLPPPLVGERLDGAIVEQVSIHFAIPIDTVKMAMHVLQRGLGDEVLVGRITLHEAYERVRAKEQAASAKAAELVLEQSRDLDSRRKRARVGGSKLR